VQTMTLKRRIGVGLLLITFLVGGAFLFEQVTKVRGSQNGELIPVMQNNKIAAYVDAGTIKQLSMQERARSKDKNFNKPNEVSLDFVLGSAGIVDYHNIMIYAVGDDEGNSLSKEGIADMTLFPNDNGTISLVDKAGGNHVKIKEVSKLLILN